MKRMIRNFLAFVLLLPHLAHYTWIRVTRGKSIAKQLTGIRITRAAKTILQKTMPKLTHPDEFDDFYPQIQKTMAPCQLIWNLNISNHSDSVQVKVTHCPVIDIFKFFKLEALNPYACQGDWEFAKENAHVWQFKREHEIGKGDAFCDHTYIRIQELQDDIKNLQTLQPQEIEL